MIAATELQTLPSFLMGAMQDDTRLSLAHAAAWLDPLRLLDPDLVEEAYYDGIYEDDQDALMLYAFSVARRCVPEAYCSMVAELRSDLSFSQVEASFCKGIREVYPYLELESLYDMVYGVPLPFVGLEVTSSEFPGEHPDYAAVLARVFDLEIVEIPATRWRGATSAISEARLELVQPAARYLIKLLIALDRQPFADLAFLLMYLFSCTGNSLLDFSTDEYWDAGFEPLGWYADMLQTANEACREMVIVLDAAERAMQLLSEDEEIVNALKTTIAVLKAAERIEDGDEPIALQWPERHWAGSLGSGASGDTDPELALAFLRDCYVQTD